MRIEYRFEPHWPPLSWVARCFRHSSVGTAGIEVHHGVLVETANVWFGECVWNGDLADADFDRSDAVFGSGGRLRDGHLTFVPAASMVDRLQVLDLGESVLVSNSLAGLLAFSGAELEHSYPRYYRDFNTVKLGYSRYKRALHTSLGEIELVYFWNVEWNGSRLRLRNKPGAHRKFRDYREYDRFLERTVRGIVLNARDGRRRRRLEAATTLSNGYDSTAVSAVVARHGVTRALSVLEQDEASASNLAAIAGALELESFIADRREALCQPLVEAEFLASGGYGYEMQWKVFEKELRGCLLFSGYYGDVVWEREQTIPARPELSRATQSGLSITEYRLLAGFIHCPLPFLGARSASDLKRISESPEMEPWRLDQRGYDRPIARRLAEERGVPRGTFGYRKMVGSLTPRSRQNFSSETYKEFLDWLETKPGRMTWGASPATIARFTNGPRRLVGEAGFRLSKWWESTPMALVPALTPLSRFMKRLRVFGREDYLFRYTFPWAVTVVGERYAARVSRTPTKVTKPDLALPNEQLASG